MLAIGGWRGQLALALPLLAGILAPMAAGQDQTCAGDSVAEFSEFADTKEFSTAHVPKNVGFRGLVVWMHKMFGEFLLPSGESEHVILGLRAADSGKDVVSSLLFGTLHILILTGFCFFLAIVVPLVALGILLSRYACGLCGGGEPSGEPENADDTNTRQKWSAVFYIITTLMTFMLVCAFYTKDHLPVAAQGAKDQAYFLVNTIPLIFDKLREDFDVLVGENLDKFQNTAARRSVDCRKETATAVDSMFQPGTVPEFFGSTAEQMSVVKLSVGPQSETMICFISAEVYLYCLRKVQARLGDIDAAITSKKITSVLDKTRPASAALQSAAQHCTPPCDAQVNQQLTQTAQALDIESHLTLPQNLKDLKQKIADKVPPESLVKIPTANSVMKAIDGAIKRVNRAMSQYQLTLKAYVREGDKNMKKISVEYHTKLEKYEKDVRTMTDEVLALYQVVIGLMSALMSAIVIQYIIAVYAGMNQAKRGFCGLYTASWMLSTAVVLFQLLFPIALSVSTVALAVGTVVDRFVCTPAQNPGAPSSLAIVDFFISKVVQEQEAKHRILENTGILFVGPALMQRDSNLGLSTSRQQHDHGVGKCGMDAGKQNKTEPDPNSTSPEAAQHAKQYAQSSLSKEQQTWRTLSETDFEEAMALSERTRQGVRKTAVTAASGQEHRSTTVTPLSSEYRRQSPDSPLAQSGSKTQARDTVLEIAQRFAKCSTDHMSYIHLLGDALALQLTRRYMGAAGAPITAIIDKEKPLPNIDTLAQQLGAGKTLNLGAELRDRLTMLSDVKSVLDEVAKLSISSQTFQQLADTATQSKASFGDIDNTKASLRGMVQNIPIDDVKRDIEKAADELDKITTDEKTGFNEQMDAVINASTDLIAACMVNGQPLPEYVRDNVADWGSKEANFRQSVEQLIGKMEEMKSGLGKDMEKFFRHARHQLRDSFGDCHSIYVLYMTTVDTFCDGAVRLFSGFWFSVWWYMVLGIPGWMLALAMSTFYARLSAVSDTSTYYF